MHERDPAALLVEWFRAGVAAADPRRATAAAVRELTDIAPIAWVIAAGKGAHSMASGAVDALAERGVRLAGGLVVAHAPDATASHGLDVVLGDHPVPGAGSFRAARELGILTDAVPKEDDALVLISGGATSLLAGPIEGLRAEDIPGLFESLLASGADIEMMNAIRKRVLRWGAGRLAVALHARRVHCLIASDVPGNDPAFIASGPCVPDESTAAEVLARAARAGVLRSLPASVTALLERQAADPEDETPRPAHPRFLSTSARIILDRHVAVAGVVEAARRAGVPTSVEEEPLTGDAAQAGVAIATHALSSARDSSGSQAVLLVWSGETTVRLGKNPGVGGRSQELALSAARALSNAGEPGRGVTILAAGTDGRDGPTDAAGAVVGYKTWDRIAAAGLDPQDALARHDAHPALDAVNALVRTGATGTNVNDLVLALIESS